MIKSVLKEIIIVLLLLLILILLLGILFYDYMPNTKTVPSKVEEYALEETIKQELEESLSNIESEEIIKTYKIDSVDIEHYERTKEYNKGKINPFAEYTTGTNNTTGNNSNSHVNTNTNNNHSNTNQEQDPSKDNFLGTTGK